MQNLSKAAKAKATRAANKAAKLALAALATADQNAVNALTIINEPASEPANDIASEPASDAPNPADVTISARAAKAATCADLLARGAQAKNIRHGTNIKINFNTYDFSHLANATLADKISGLPAGSQAFYLDNIKAFAGQTLSASQFDNAKLARTISAGLLVSAPPYKRGAILTGNVTITFPEK